MTRKQYLEKCMPVFEDYLEGMQKDGVMAVANAFDIAVVKEVLFRLNYDAADKDDEVPEFAEMTPEFFLEDILNMCEDWDNMGELFVNEYDQGYETFCSIIRTAGKDWEARNEDEEQ